MMAKNTFLLVFLAFLLYLCTQLFNMLVMIQNDISIIDATALLQRELSSGRDICCTRSEASAFPEILRKDFLIEHIALVICHKGFFTFTIGEEECKIGGGHTLFISRDVLFKVISSSADCRYSLLFYRIDSIREILGNTIMGMKFLDVVHPLNYNIVRNDEVPELWHYLALFRNFDTCNGDVFIEKESLLLKLSLTYRLCSIFSRLNSHTDALSNRQTEIYINLIQLIEKHYETERSVSFYADKLCLSPKYLSAISKSVSGLTVQQHIFRAIIRRGIFLMNNTDKSVKQISDLLHFPNPSAFGTFFKKHTGLSPRNYRRK